MVDFKQDKPRFTLPEKKEEPKMEEPKTHVKMVRNKEQYPGPHSATVHVSEVDNWKLGGWKLDGSN